MTIPVSVCCLLASPRVSPQEWPTGFFWKELTDDTADDKKAMVIKEFVELDVDREAFAMGEFDTDVLMTTAHPGHIERCDGIDFASVVKFNEYREQRRHVISQTHTVCGMVLETGQCYSGLWSAAGPLIAVTMAWDHMQDDELTLLVSCVHEGIVPRAEWTPTYADPVCLTEEAMQSKLIELGVNNHG